MFRMIVEDVFNDGLIVTVTAIEAFRKKMAQANRRQRRPGVRRRRTQPAQPGRRADVADGELTGRAIQAGITTVSSLPLRSTRIPARRAMAATDAAPSGSARVLASARANRPL